MMSEHDGIHPDEGTIHAWLDDALDAAEASRIALHVESCAECAGRVAEARGLIAGASRVVRLLDDEPAPMLAPSVVPKPVTPISRWLRVTPARAAIAATLLVVAGLTLTRDKVAVESVASFTDSAVSMVAPAASAPVADASAPQEARALEQDSVLASAIARRIREETPQRTIGNAAGAAIPAAPPPVASAQSANTGAAQKVAAGRDSARLAEVVVTAAASDRQMVARDAAPVSGTGCYRLESRDGAGTWAGLPLPAEIALAATAAPGEAGSDGARTSFAITPIGGGTAIGSWSRTAGDTLALILRSSFATTTGIIYGSGSSLSGTLQASPTDARPSSAPAAAQSRADTRMRQSAGAGSATANTVRIAMRSISCPR